MLAVNLSNTLLSCQAKGASTSHVAFILNVKAAFCTVQV